MSDEIKEAVELEETAAVGEPTMEAIVRDPNAPVMTMRKLLENGVYFGHQTRRWNPKMARYIFGARHGIYLIDLNKTILAVNEAYAKLQEIVLNGGKVLFVGTKPAAQQIVVEEATRSGSFYIAHRWLGGTLTNFRTIQTRIKRLKDLENLQETGQFETLPKKEVALLRKELEKLQKNLEGIKEMRKLPNAVVVDDPTVEHNAVIEAQKLGIPVFAICDTSDDPDLVTFPIPSNNDGSAALRLLIGVLADAVVEAKGGLTVIAHVADEGEEPTMKDAIAAADAANAARKKAILERRRAIEERNARIQAERAARYAARQAEKAAAAEEKPAEEEAK